MPRIEDMIDTESVTQTIQQIEFRQGSYMSRQITPDIQSTAIGGLL